MASLQQLAANRANAQLSTGPTSSEGKAKVSHNALKTGLTGRTILLPSDDVAAYQAQADRIFKQFAPETDEEKRLTRRDLNNLSVQEARLRRQYEKDEAKLKRQIAERAKAANDSRVAEGLRWGKAILHYQTARERGIPFDPAEIGFEFSTEEIAARERELKGAIDMAAINTRQKAGSNSPTKPPESNFPHN